MKNTDERLVKILQATPEKLAEIDRVLEGTAAPRAEAEAGPLLLSMSAAAKLLGTSRATLWRMTKSGRIGKVQLLPGSSRVRRSDLLALVAQKEV